MHIAVASKNPTKVSAVQMAAHDVLQGQYRIATYKVDSGVAAQPRGLAETYQGACNRATTVLGCDDAAELGVGLEGGLLEIGDRLVDFGLVVVLGRGSVSGLGMSPGLALPDALVSTIDNGAELSEAVAEHYGTNTIEDRDCSAVLTDGRLPANELYRQATVLALTDFLAATRAAQ